MTGHVNPLSAGAGILSDAGHEVVFVSTGPVRQQVESMGIRFFPSETGGSVDLDAPNAGHPERESVPLGPEWALFDFLPMDTMLGHADLLVTNGGFNTVMRAHSEGVPLVVADEGADKAEFAARVAFACSGINLGTGGPTVPSVKEAVDTRLAGGSYRRKAEETKAKLASMDTPVMVVRLLEAVQKHADRAVVTRKPL